MLIHLLGINFIITLVGSTIAGLNDLKTTEIPDEIPLLLGFYGLLSFYFYALSSGNFKPLILSIITGAAFGLFGLLMYKTKQWGGGDSALLSSIGYALPYYPGIQNFALNFFTNIFLIGLGYILIYIIAIGVLNKIIISLFWKEIKHFLKRIILPLIFVLIAEVFIFNAICITVLLLGLALFIKYALIVEKKYFTRKIKSSELKPGDVLNNEKWRGLTKEEIKMIQKKSKYVTIKDGVRFGPVFPIALLITFLFGGVF